MATLNDPSPGGPPDRAERTQQVVDFWNALSVGGESGETTWGVLEEIQAEVTDCLSREPKDLERAEGLTAYAAMLMSGQVIF
jgi:hypothetical protein